MRKCWLLRLKLTKNRRLQFLHAVSHSVNAHTESLQLRDDNSSSSSSSEDKASQAPVPAVTTSTASESSAASTSDCCEVCLVAPRAGFALVTCGHARFCEPCAMRVSEMAAGCPVCRTYITMVIYIFLRLCQPTLQILEH